LFVFDLLYTLLVQSSPEQARESNLRTMNALDMTK
ncbi:MurR/RpiR family transcriptional regulator, partial [Salmonella enterica subsp. enterica]